MPAPSRFGFIEYALVASLLVTVLLSGYMTVVRLFYGTQHVAYDSWIFGMGLALLLQLYDKHEVLHG
jgi:hypothetical protein